MGGWEGRGDKWRSTTMVTILKELTSLFKSLKPEAYSYYNHLLNINLFICSINISTEIFEHVPELWQSAVGVGGARGKGIRW